MTNPDEQNYPPASPQAVRQNGKVGTTAYPETSLSGHLARFGMINALLRLNPASRNALRQLTARRIRRRLEGRRQSEIKLCL
jgi:hypothetical protein